MKELLTIQGETFLVDDEDYEKAKKYRWAKKTDRERFHIVTYETIEGFSYRGISYKRLILGIGSKMTLYKNDNPLDLRRENILVFDTRSEFISSIKSYRKKRTELNIKVSKAAQGKGGKSTKKTTYLGVRYEINSLHKWTAFIKHNYKNYYLGCFVKEEYAALSYDKKALELYGEEAIRNFPHLSLEEIKEKLKEIKAEDDIIFYDKLSKRHQGRLFSNVNKTSKYIGVCINKGRTKWRATIFYHNKQYSLGEYYNEEDAARAYDKKAFEFYGESARLNFPRE